MDSQFTIGLMSGTSLDGVDAVLAEFAQSVGGLRAHSRQHVHLPFDAQLQSTFRDLNTAGVNEIHRMALAGNGLAKTYAQAVLLLLERSGIDARQVQAIGAHGQTVRHQPGQGDGIGYSVQVTQPALLAELTGISVVADFRSRDIAAGGQGAPLVPAFHQHIFADKARNVAVLNLGGIANISLICIDGRLLGLDTGPANVLLDAWCLMHTGKPWDDAGQWAAGGEVNQSLLDVLLQEPYFAQLGAKSTGLDLFNMQWLLDNLKGFGQESAKNVQATLVELTALTVVNALKAFSVDVGVLGVCGGGVYNHYLMRRLQALVGKKIPVQSTQAWGVDPLHVEALAFAWLARQCLLGLPGNVPAVTNARGARILGSIYQA